jgi:hypothetical protein
MVKGHCALGVTGGLGVERFSNFLFKYYDALMGTALLTGQSGCVMARRLSQPLG